MGVFKGSSELLFPKRRSVRERKGRERQGRARKNPIFCSVNPL